MAEQEKKKKKLEEMMAKTFQNLMKNIILYIQET